mmetsp:Transcript_4906/g.6366  ORF Transcript_4906/g.6366 Transcript_4906/m.6366 type:complete len:97 (+) Transcript_4906:83-373(+)
MMIANSQNGNSTMQMADQTNEGIANCLSTFLPQLSSSYVSTPSSPIKSIVTPASYWDSMGSSMVIGMDATSFSWAAPLSMDGDSTMDIGLYRPRNC